MKPVPRCGKMAFRLSSSGHLREMLINSANEMKHKARRTLVDLRSAEF